MNDDRIEELLRAGPPDEPARGSLPDPGARIPAGAAPRPRWSLGALRLVPAAVVALVLVALAGMLLPGGRPDPTPDLPARIRAGVLRVGVSDGEPQLRREGSVQGFDMDVATALGKRLGVTVQVVPGEPAGLLAADPGLDALLLAIPSGVDTPPLRSGAPYLWRAGAVVAPSTAPIPTPAQLEGRTVCVAAGGAAAAWLGGGLPPDAEALPVPRVPVETRDTLEACLAAAAADGWAVVVDDAYDTISLPPGLEVAPFTPFALPSAPRVLAGNPDGDTILAALDIALDALRRDGTLAGLSRHRFAGRDFTTRP